MEVKAKIKNPKNIRNKKKKLSNIELDKAIMTLSKEVNRSMTQRYLMDIALGRR